MTTHLAKRCMVSDCEAEARYFIRTHTGFRENELTPPPPGAFFLCIRHESDLNGNGEDDGGYVHLRVDTGELRWIEISDYLCSPDCSTCRD